ncbi:hypothetical protein JQX13_21330 [Archangium violaceum]|uniref:hypothetical protein n=1 Tax=Archangium violaceum TaxID=83451 RepID=UPI00193C77BE|nr:hypothetical protein [Archangium violaceum]QRK12341.1 hypothetical protein JQX13_21330 [Archangium violaceum]
MSKWAAGLGWVSWCVLCATGCQKPEVAVTAASARSAVSEAPRESPPARPTAFVELPEPPPTETRDAEPPPEPEPTLAATVTHAEEETSRLLETDSGTWEREERRATRPLLEDEDRIWLSETAESARAGNTRISASAPVEEITIATGTVDGRVKRVRSGTIEVSDDEGNVYELRIDGRSRGLSRGRRIPLKNITEGTPVRASFDLVGRGESLARDIVLRR